MIFDFKILVCGGRDFKDRELEFDCLYRICKRIRKSLDPSIPIVIIEGGARCADRFAKQFAKRYKHKFNINHLQIPADWDRYGNSAGMRRNKKMRDTNPLLCVAFQGGTGTENMVGLCIEHGIKVKQIHW